MTLTHPEAIGRPIPGGSLSIRSADGWPDGTGELVYRGANVMLGYAQRPADLALGATIEELRTGDIARRTPEGLYEIIGRSGRFVKLFGLRIDLDRVQRGLAERGVTALRTDDVDALAVAAVDTGKASTDEVRQLTAALADIPAGSVRATVVPESPRLISGKPDYAAVRTLAAEPPATDVADLKALFAEVLHVPVQCIDPDGSFIDLGGNSLPYVAMSVRLERALGRLPKDWPDDGAGPGAPLRASPASVGNRGNQRRPARRSHCPDRRLACRVVRTVGRCPHPARHGRLQLRPVLPHTCPAVDTVAAPAQHHRLDRGACHRLGRRRADPHRRVPLVEPVAGQQIPRAARQYDRRAAVVRRSGGLDPGGTDRGVRVAGG